MNKQEAKNLIKETFSSNFNSEQYQEFVANLFKKYTPIEKMVSGQYIKESFRQFIVKYKRVGKFEDSENNIIDILEVYLSKSSTLERARTAQRNFVAEYLKSRNKEAALVAFVSPDNKEWRLSLVKLEHSLVVIDDKLKTKEEITPAKRWSFLVGKNEGSHTAQSRFVDILITDENPNLKELEQAFDIETVTKEFFDKYTELFFQLKEHLDDLLEKDEIIKKDFKEKEISTVDFAKKTLGQIVFLYFLQKKGWFGVAPDKQWGEGPKKFLRELFKARKKYGKNFFNDILEPLFYKALAQDRGRESIYPELNNCRMPFLNGGLFEPILNYSWETTDIVIPDDLFSNDITDKKTGDTGTGILDVFDRYNFTVNENEPLEKEVAVDPEMLGKVFENLLDIKDRKSKGAFYTPREIVHYMCQQSLINYLETETRNEIPREDLELFIQKGDRIIENDKIALARQESNIKKYGREYNDATYSLLLPISVRTKAKKLDDLLKNIKVADPAVGSGAFPLGMINEIVRARKVLNVYLKSDISDYEFKKHTITHSIYGVDIDPGAVDIAKLRLWLALVVDEETPHPLPNLEHKIMQGNSLLSEYEGIKLFDDSIFEDAQDIEKEKTEINSKLSLLQKEYFELHKNNELTEVKKAEIEKEIKSLQRRLKSFIQKPDISSETIGLFDTPQKKKIAQEKANILQKKIEEYITESRRTNKQNLKEEIDKLKWDLIEISLEEQDKTDKLEEIKKLRHKNIKPFFIWKLEFSDVFKEKGGFDVVIGNPPYIMEYENKNAFMGLHNHSCYQGKTDIWHLFTGLGLDLLKNKGVVTYIAKNQWLTSSSASNMREKIYSDSDLKFIIDFGANLMFENADVQTMVFLAQKNYNNDLHNLNYIRFEKQDINNIKSALERDSFTFSKKNIEKNYDKTANLTFSSSINENILEKINSKKNFEFDPKKEIIQGIIGGPDKAFIIKKDELSKFNNEEKEYLKMLHTNTGRFFTPDTDKYIFYISKKNFDTKNIEDFPNIKEYFAPYKDDLSQKKINYKTPHKPYFYLHRERDENFFKEGAKLVWAKRTEGERFTYTEKSMYGTANLFFIKSDKVNLKYITALLNSKLMYFYMSERLKHTGDLLQLDKNQFLKIPLSVPEAQKPFIDLVDQILEITSATDYDPKNPPVEQKKLEKQIDEMVYKLYDLTEEEIKIVEESSKK